MLKTSRTFPTTLDRRCSTVELNTDVLESWHRKILNDCDCDMSESRILNDESRRTSSMQEGTAGHWIAYNACGFMGPTTDNQSSDCQSMPYPQTSPLAAHRPTRLTAIVPPLPKDPTNSSSMIPSVSNHYQQVSPRKFSNHQKQDETPSSHEHSSKSLISIININDLMTTKPTSMVQQEDKPRVHPQKLHYEDSTSPSKSRPLKGNVSQQLDHLPADFTPDLIKELLQDGYSLDSISGERSLRQWRSMNSNTTSETNSPKKKRVRTSSLDDDDEAHRTGGDDDDEDEETNEMEQNDELQPLRKRIRRTNDNALNSNTLDVMSALKKKTRDRLDETQNALRRG